MPQQLASQTSHPPCPSVQRIVLHIGTHKTGTSSIQATCAKGRRVLSKAGICYPRLKNMPTQTLLSVPFFDTYVPRQFFHRFGTEKPAVDVQAWSFWQDVHRQLSKKAYHTLVLSSEFFVLIDRIPALLAHLKALCPNAEVEAICYLRDPVGFFLSSLQQTVKFSGKVAWPEAFGWAERLKPWAKAVPLVLRSFERSRLVQEDVVMDFMTHLCGEEIPDTLEPCRRNEGVSAEAVEILYQYRRAVHSGQDDLFTRDSNHLVRLLQTTDRRLSEQDGAVPKTELQDTVRELVLCRNSKDLLTLRDELGFEFSQTSLYDVDNRMPVAEPMETEPTVRDLIHIDDARLNTLHMQLLKRLTTSMEKQRQRQNNSEHDVLAKRG